MKGRKNLTNQQFYNDTKNKYNGVWEVVKPKDVNRRWWLCVHTVERIFKIFTYDEIMKKERF